jgi:hypothetical protein
VFQILRQGYFNPNQSHLKNLIPLQIHFFDFFIFIDIFNEISLADLKLLLAFFDFFMGNHFFIDFFLKVIDVFSFLTCFQSQSRSSEVSIHLFSSSRFLIFLQLYIIILFQALLLSFSFLNKV